MGEKKYTITGSNYTLKRKHKSLSDATIYERDYMATTNLGGFDSGVFPNEEGNFKMVPVDNTTIRKKHNYGSKAESFTLNDISQNRNRESTESRLVETTEYSSLLDFVYYGSCVEFLQSSIQNIILTFPGEIFFTNKALFEDETGTTWYRVDNPFNIDIWSVKAPDGRELNDLHYFALEAEKYVIYRGNGNEIGCLDNISSWQVATHDEFKFCNKDYSHEITIFGNKIRRFLINGQYVLGYKDASLKYAYIRPSQSMIDNAFESMNVFEKILLNRDTNPLYTAVLDYPHETETGFQTYKKAFTWPIKTYLVSTNSTRKTHSYNIDITSEKYEMYVEDLLKLCTFYDENFTDNIWRNLTHDAIKNLDNTFIHENSDESEKDTKENVEKVKKFLLSCGRQFDEIKRYADGIKNVNAVTYNNERNLPDYSLTDVLGLSGWEISNSLTSLKDKNTAKISGLFTGESNKVYDDVDTNVRFLRNLKLNSREILSRKGTKAGIEMILGLFGMVSDDFARSIGQEAGDYSIDEYVNIATPNENSIFSGTSDTVLDVEKYGRMRLGRSEYSSESTEPEATEGLPVKVITYTDGDITYKCMVPWFTMKDEYGKPYSFDGGLYFQMYGGWDKNDTQYGETLNYLNICEKESDLTYIPLSKVEEGDFCYCVNEGIYKKFNNGKWDDVDSADTEAIERIEAVVNVESGNNPHVGFGRYDSGAEFYEYLKKIFKDAIDNDGFSEGAYLCNGGYAEGLEECGFDIEEVRDNVKCWFYTDDSNFGENDFSGIYEYDNFEPYDFKEGDTSSVLSEHSAYSVINSKNMVLTFKIPSASWANDYKQYIKDAVMPYVRQMIPSTTIFSVTFE